MQDILGYGILFQHTAARRRLDKSATMHVKFKSFNTQPPEGGWLFRISLL